MRILNILSGLAVLLTSLAFAHLLHRYFIDAGKPLTRRRFWRVWASALWWAHFHLLGGCLLIRRGR